MAMQVETGAVSATANVTGTDSSYPAYVLLASSRTEAGSGITTLESGIVKKNDVSIGSFSAKNIGGTLKVNIMNVDRSEIRTVSILVDELVVAVQPDE